MLEVIISDKVKRLYKPYGKETMKSIAKKLHVSTSTVQKSLAYLNGITKRCRKTWPNRRKQRARY
jgi:predicted transcriptional regulator